MNPTKIFFFTILSFFIFSMGSCDIIRDVLNQSVNTHATCLPQTSAQFQLTHNLVKAKRFPHDRLTASVRETKNAGCLSSNQIGRIAELNTFEHDRLDYLKFAYAHCSDQNNYHMNLDLLTFPHSREELEQIIR